MTQNQTVLIALLLIPIFLLNISSIGMTQQINFTPLDQAPQSWSTPEIEIQKEKPKKKNTFLWIILGVVAIVGGVAAIGGGDAGGGGGGDDDGATTGGYEIRW